MYASAELYFLCFMKYPSWSLSLFVLEGGGVAQLRLSRNWGLKTMSEKGEEGQKLGIFFGRHKCMTPMKFH